MTLGSLDEWLLARVLRFTSARTYMLLRLRLVCRRFDRAVQVLFSQRLGQVLSVKSYVPTLRLATSTNTLLAWVHAFEDAQVKRAWMTFAEQFRWTTFRIRVRRIRYSPFVPAPSIGPARLCVCAHVLLLRRKSPSGRPLHALLVRDEVYRLTRRGRIHACSLADCTREFALFRMHFNTVFVDLPFIHERFVGDLEVWNRLMTVRTALAKTLRRTWDVPGSDVLMPVLCLFTASPDSLVQIAQAVAAHVHAHPPGLPPAPTACH